MNDSAIPLVSVLIPCYNAGQWIGETLDSVLAQTWPRLEIIVVDDGSTDNSPGILNDYLRHGIEVIRQGNRGQPAAFNRCLAEANGQFIQYLDSDDLLEPRKIELQLRRLLEHPGAIATAEWARFIEDPSEACFREYETWRDMDPVEWLVADWKDGGGMMYPAMWLLPRGLVEAIGPWREELTLVNEAEYFTRAVLASKKVLFGKGSRTFYRSGIKGSLSGMKSRDGWNSQIRVIEYCQRYLLEREDSERTRRVVSMLWQRFAHASYPYCRDLANQALMRASSLHPSELQPEGGPIFQTVAKILGWKASRVLQRISGRN